MAGTVRGSIEHFIPTSNTDPNTYRNAFTALVKFFLDHPNWTGVASQGNGAGAPSTWTYSGGANPPGDNAWAVFRKGGSNSYHVLIQWSFSSVFGTSPGNPGDVPSNYYNGIQMAYDTSGGTSIWNGTSADDGTDSKGTPVWVADGGNLIVHPRGNGAGGSFNTNKEACAQFFTSATPNRFQVVGDDDYVWMAQDQSNNAQYDRCLYLGPFAAADGVSVTGPLLCMLQSPGNLVDGATVGTTGNTSGNAEGGVATSAATSESRSFRYWIHGVWFTATYQPNAQRVPPSYDMMDIPISLSDAQGSGSYGLIGFVDLVKFVHNVPTHDTTAGLTKAFFGTTQGTHHWVVDWDGLTVPGSGGTVEGVQFP